MEVEEENGKTQGCFDNSFSKINERFIDAPSPVHESYSFQQGNESSYRIPNPFAMESSEPLRRLGSVPGFVDGSQALTDTESTNKSSNPLAMKPSEPTGIFQNAFTSVIRSQVFVPSKKNSEKPKNPFAINSSEPALKIENVPCSMDENQMFPLFEERSRRTSNPLTMALSQSTCQVSASTNKRLLLAPPKLQLKLPIQTEKLVKQTDRLCNAGALGGKEKSGDKNNSCMSTSENVTKMCENEHLAGCISISSDNAAISIPSSNTKSIICLSDENKTNVGFIFGQNLHERVLNYQKQTEQSSSYSYSYKVPFDEAIINKDELEKMEIQKNLGEKLEKSLPHSAKGSYHVKKILGEDGPITNQDKEIENKNKLQKSLAESTEDYDAIQFKRKFKEVDNFELGGEEMEMQKEDDKFQMSECTKESESNHLKRKFEEVSLFEGKAPKTEVRSQMSENQINFSKVPEDCESNQFKIECDENKEEEIKMQNLEESKKSLSERANEYESKQVKRKYAEVSLITGEEEEKNVLQINCKLFSYDKASQNWQERGRGLLRLNDKESKENNDSRLLMRINGSLKVVLNVKLWEGMSIEHSSERAMQFTAYEPEGVKVFLVMAEPRAVKKLFHALDFRVAKLNGKEVTSTRQPLIDDKNISDNEVSSSSSVLHDYCIHENSGNEDSDSSYVESDSFSGTN